MELFILILKWIGGILLGIALLFSCVAYTQESNRDSKRYDQCVLNGGVPEPIHGGYACQRDGVAIDRWEASW